MHQYHLTALKITVFAGETRNREVIDTYKYPHKMTFDNNWLKTTSGKIHRIELREKEAWTNAT